MQEKIENILNSINLKKVNVHFYVHLITLINFWKKKISFRQVRQKREKERERKVRKVRRRRAREDDCKVVTRWLVEHAEKDLGFLRIGSLNVRVKRTTEAFSQFLGVATSSASSNHEKIHKSWGSADNVQVQRSRKFLSLHRSTLYNYSTLGRSTIHSSLLSSNIMLRILTLNINLK